MEKIKMEEFTAYEMALNDRIHLLNKTLEMIKARIQGEFDNPALIEFGMLSPNINQDVLDMIEKIL
jgi:hypothetical protein